MAAMIPNDVEEFQTEGERVFFQFLQPLAMHDARYVVWDGDVGSKTTCRGNGERL